MFSSLVAKPSKKVKDVWGTYEGCGHAWLGPEAAGGRCGWDEGLHASSSRTLGWRLILRTQRVRRWLRIITKVAHVGKVLCCFSHDSTPLPGLTIS